MFPAPSALRQPQPAARDRLTAGECPRSSASAGRPYVRADLNCTFRPFPPSAKALRQCIWPWDARNSPAFASTWTTPGGICPLSPSRRHQARTPQAAIIGDRSRSQLGSVAISSGLAPLAGRARTSGRRCTASLIRRVVTPTGRPGAPRPEVCTGSRRAAGRRRSWSGPCGCRGRLVIGNGARTRRRSVCRRLSPGGRIFSRSGRCSPRRLVFAYTFLDFRFQHCPACHRTRRQQ